MRIFRIQDFVVAAPICAMVSPHSEYLNQLEVHLRLALNDQSQCRATLETLVR